MWKITYTIDYNYRDNDNYPSVDNGYVRSVHGATMEKAINKLLINLKKENVLDSIIKTEALRLDSYDNCNSLSILSIEEITGSEEIYIFDHPAFRTLIDNCKAEDSRKKVAIEKQKEYNNRKHELAQLKKLQKKYINT